MATARTKPAPAPVERPQAPAVAARDPIQELLARMRPAIAAAVPRHIDPDRMVRILLTTVRTSPILRQMALGPQEERNSLLAAMIVISQLGLEPGPLGQVSIVPFRRSSDGRYEAQVIVEYKGYLALARRSGEIESIQVEPVYPEDEFQFELGLNPRLVHRPALDRPESSKPKLYYGIARFRGGGFQLRVMTLREIEQYRKRSRSADSGPWVTDYDAMCRKTVIRRMWPYLPVSAELQRAAALDESAGLSIPSPGMVAITPGYAAESEELVVDVTPATQEPQPSGAAQAPELRRPDTGEQPPTTAASQGLFRPKQ